MKNLNKTLPLAIGILSFSLSIPAAAQASKFTSIYAFGDSLSDNGNIYAASGGTYPPSPPYFNGRYSNGPIWVEDLATSLDIPLVDYAYGGATTGTTNLGGTVLPGLQQEINLLFAPTHPQGADPNALYTIWAGANDYLFTTSTPTESLNNIGIAVKTLSNLGAKNFLVVNLPDLGKLPIVNRLPAPSSYYTGLTNQHNAGLLSAIYGQGLPTDVKVTQLDVYSLSNNIFANPTQYGLTNLTDSCLNSSTLIPCSNPSQYFFWDEVHPTTGIHSLIAQQAANAVPEPLTILGTMTALGLGAGLKRKLVKKNSSRQG